MKAIVLNDYGSVDALELKEVEKPEIKENEVLVRIQAASINAGDLFSMKGRPWLTRLMVGFPKPKDYILGWDMAGRVEAIGCQVTRFQPGDDVFASSSGTLAEFATAPEDAVAMIPSNQSWLRASRLRADRRDCRPTGTARCWRDSSLSKSPDQRCLGRGGDVRRADCQGVRSGSDRGLQHFKNGSGPIAQRGRGGRLHQRGLHTT